MTLQQAYKNETRSPAGAQVDVATDVCHLVEAEYTIFLHFKFNKKMATATFVWDGFYNVKMPKF